MPVRIAIVGPGRVGQAFARQFAASGASVLGFVGRDGARTRAAVAALGTGRALACSDLVAAHVVVFAVGDGELEAAVAAAAAAGGRRCCLWLHTSGRHDLSVFAHSAALGVRPMRTSKAGWRSEDAPLEIARSSRHRLSLSGRPNPSRRSGRSI
jgi:NAD(P)-dependent dehydrogenase (short-subunit alcohol dehydrogenase family)